MANKYVIHGATYNGDGTTSSEAVGSTVTITIASPGVVTWTGHTFVANDPVYFTTTGALPTGITANTKYYVRNPATNTFEISATSGGASINTSGTQSGTHTATGVGAWNSLLTSMGGSPGKGSIAAGDNIYVKCPAGTTTIDMTASITTTSGTRTAPINWFFDDGTIWSGANGTIKLRSNAAGSYQVIFSAFSNWYAKNFNFEVWGMYTGSGVTLIFYYGACAIHGVYFRQSTVASGRLAYHAQAQGTTTTFVNCKFEFAQVYAGYGLFLSSSYSKTNFIGCTFDMTSTPDIQVPICSGGQYGQQFTFVGGGVTGGTSNHYLVYGYTVAMAQLNVKIDGFYTGLLNLNLLSYVSTGSGSSVLSMSNIPNTIFGSTYSTNIGECYWRDGQNYPTLNAILPDAASTYWSYKVYPRYAAPGTPMEFPLKQKFYTSTAATKTLTIELLINNTYTNPKQNEYWMEVSYIQDSDGSSKTISSFEYTPVAGSTNLVSSTAGWSTTTYGAASYSKYKISVTTPTAIKQNTIILVRLLSTRAPTLTSDFFFVDPEVTLT